MTSDNLIRVRLHGQHLLNPKFTAPGEIVSWLGAVQAQDYFGSLWSIGQRLREDVHEADVERAIAEKQIVRTWPMRGTLHFVSPKDVRWMLQHLTPRVLARMSGRLRQLGLDKKVLTRCKRLWVKALEGEKQLTRDELYAILERNRISVAESRGLHILSCLAQEGIISFAQRRGKQQTFALLDEWLPSYPILKKEAALGELALRYVKSHGPATTEDFMWWAGLTKADATAGLESVKPQLVTERLDKMTYWLSPDAPASGSRERAKAWLLPTYDEYSIAYKDRSAIVDPSVYKITQSMFTSMIAFNGRGIGLWRRTISNGAVIIEVKAFGKFNASHREAIEEASQRYGRFIGRKPELLWG